MSKILAICLTSFKGGAESVFIQALKNIDENNLYVISSECLDIKVKNNLTLPNLIKISESYYSFFRVLKFSLFNNKKKYKYIDFYYCNNLESVLFAILINFFNFKKAKIIFHIHDIYNMKSFKVRILFNGLSKVVYHAIALTQINEKRLEPYFSKISTVQNYTEIFSLNYKKKIIIDELTLGYIGQITPWKGIEQMLVYVNSCKIKNKKINLIISGKPNSEKDLMFQEKLKSNFNFLDITWTGFVSKEFFFNKIHILLSFSTNEPFGLVLIESLSFGVPILSKPGDGPSEIIQNGSGIIFNSEEEFKDGVSSIINDYGCYQIRAFTQSKSFSKEIFKNQLNAVFK